MADELEIKVRINPEEYRTLSQIAQREGLSLDQVIKTALQEWCNGGSRELTLDNIELDPDLDTDLDVLSGRWGDDLPRVESDSYDDE